MEVVKEKQIHDHQYCKTSISDGTARLSSTQYYNLRRRRQGAVGDGVNCGADGLLDGREVTVEQLACFAAETFAQ